MEDVSDPASARLLTENGESYEGLCVEVEAESTTVDFLPDEAPSLRIGEEVQLEFRQVGLPGSIRAQAWTTYRGEDAARRRYRFEIKRELGLALSVMTNRRDAFRIVPRSDHPVPLTVEPLLEPGSADEAPTVPVECDLDDLSLTGLSMFVSGDAEAELFRSDVLRLTLPLPSAPAPILTKVRVRYRALTGMVIRYGVEFMGEDQVERQRLHQHVSAYVMARQAEHLRRIRG